MNVKLHTSWLYTTLIVGLSVWVLQSFLLAFLVACVTAVASWPLYRRFAARLPQRLKRGGTPLMFTAVMAVFVLAPLTFAFGALVAETHALLLAISAADRHGIAAPDWLEKLPLAGSWLAGWWQRELAHPGALDFWAQRIGPAALFAWVQSFGHFMARHLFIIAFTILVLFFLYREGESIAGQFRRLLRDRLGEQAERSLDLATRALRASTNSMLVVALFNGVATGVVYALAGIPHAAVWAAITGALALVPFLGYVAVAIAVSTLALAVPSSATSVALAFIAGSAVLFFGDKVLRPAIGRDGTGLPFVWVLMGCLGGFEVLGLVGVVVGPVVLTLARGLWEQGVRDLARARATAEGHATRRRDIPPGGTADSDLETPARKPLSEQCSLLT
jgi:predicted PurR-regulated permease PerM